MINRFKDRTGIVTPLKEASFRLFRVLDIVGLHLMPKHYYTPVPDYRWLRANRSLWSGPVPLTGVDWDLDRQFAWLEKVCTPYIDEVRGLDLYEAASLYGEGFGPIESQVLHCALRAARPRRIIEIGSGVSTACILHAVAKNGDCVSDTSVTCIEPFPKKAFMSLPRIVHIQKLCQEVSQSVYDELQCGDLLFIDSSHAVKLGSDVNHLLLRVIPRLAPGVFVHIHDINLPYSYNRDALENYFGWQETALVLALLTGNRSLSVLACLSALHYDRPDQLASLLPDYSPQENDDGMRPSPTAPGHFPASLWLQTQ